MTTERVVIAGAGPAGLVAARHLADAGVGVTVYEAEETVGGRVATRTVDGYTLDRGFQVLFTGYPAVQRELDLDALDLRAFKPGAVICRPNSRSVVGDPLRDPGSISKTLFNREITTGDAYRLWKLRRELRSETQGAIFSGADRTIREELERREFSEGFIEAFAAPFLGGITLDRSLGTSKRVFEYVMKVLNDGKTVVPADGMGAITDQLADRAREAGATIETGRRVDSVKADDTGGDFDLGSETVDGHAAIVATDAPTARDLTGVDAIPTTGNAVATQYYTLPAHAAPPGKRLHLNAESEQPNTLVTLSNVAPEYAADADRALLSATFLGDPDATNAKLDDKTRRALTKWYPERQFGDLQLLDTHRIEFAQFVQPPRCHDDLPGVAAPDGRCYLAGEYTQWSSIQGAMQSGRDAAQRVLADLS
ncbi:NAD(P)/FAD-dependent oxidoreductase [Salinarchaeum laminariae]|uniref:NAD(P)/FAD-dependent oxidoreductase n=1 Tax=Salinarchaeum laminariae TaxID=869888 RepID=UPI0020BFA11A|nr:NAD(P)/FAD-dependent oxidoreductase [Salinarchaeum laminariae]